MVYSHLVCIMRLHVLCVLFLCTPTMSTVFTTFTNFVLRKVCTLFVLSIFMVNYTVYRVYFMRIPGQTYLIRPNLNSSVLPSLFNQLLYVTL